MNNYINSGDILTVTAPADVTSGQLIKVGGIIGVCATDADSGDAVEIQTRGVFRLPKATGFVPAAGGVAFFDFDTDEKLEASGEPVGFYTHSALTGDTQARVWLNPGEAINAVDKQTVSIYLAPGSAMPKTGVYKAPFAGKLKALEYFTDAKPTSALGTVLLVARNAAVGPDNTLLNAANFDMENATEDAVTAFTLTSTAADLALDAGECFEFVATPNNADVVAGTGFHILVTFERT